MQVRREKRSKNKKHHHPANTLPSLRRHQGEKGKESTIIQNPNPNNNPLRTKRLSPQTQISMHDSERKNKPKETTTFFSQNTRHRQVCFWRKDIFVFLLFFCCLSLFSFFPVCGARKGTNKFLLKGKRVGGGLFFPERKEDEGGERQR